VSVPLGVMLPVTEDAHRIVALGQQAAASGFEELWVAEDLGLHGGIALAAVVLASTTTVRVGLGIAPAAARHPAFLAMQAATLAQAYPGRFMLGVGHGMPEWMRSLGIWPASPLARLEETLVGIRALLRGDTCDLEGSEVTMDDVRLATAPVAVPILAGVRGPRSLEVAGRAADGVVLAGYAGPEYIGSARAILDLHRSEPARIVASARFAIGTANDLEGPQQRMRRDLVDNLDGLRTMLPHRSTTDPGAGVDDALLRAVSITGSTDALRAGIQRWHDAGADLVLLDPLSADDLERALADR
jgi:5,10-methylenetetrahydromethanopterin reductase